MAKKIYLETLESVLGRSIYHYYEKKSYSQSNKNYAYLSDDNIADDEGNITERKRKNY